jgi:3-isopropylmalate/(R)-2-methylmalate dehydratase small subunit
MSVATSRRRATEDLAKHALEAADLSWPKTSKPGDIVISGAISDAAARESAPLWASRGRGSPASRSPFARIFYRNSINIELPLLILKEDDPDRTQGRQAWIAVDAGTLKFVESGPVLRGVPLAPIVRDILRAGGLMPYVAAKTKMAALPGLGEGQFR